MSGAPSFSRPEDLLERALVELRATLAGYVETSCGVDAELRPVPGSCEAECVAPIEQLLGLVRDIEAMIGTPADLGWTPDMAGPEWLTDLVAGKWGLT
jgi:hypothetical protein